MAHTAANSIECFTTVAAAYLLLTLLLTHDTSYADKVLISVVIPNAGCQRDVENSSVC